MSHRHGTAAMKHTGKVAVAWLAALLVLLVLYSVYCERQVTAAAAGLCYSDARALPRNRVGLLLGTGRLNLYGDPNPYYYRRVDAAARLYRLHKIDTVLISGNHTGAYNEPAMMRADLEHRGVPGSVIVDDGKGYSTSQSISRARQVYRLRRFTVISQRFHNERALYMARDWGLDCVAYDCGNYQGSGFKAVRMVARERLSRLKAVTLHILSLKCNIS